MVNQTKASSDGLKPHTLTQSSVKVFDSTAYIDNFGGNLIPDASSIFGRCVTRMLDKMPPRFEDLTTALNNEDREKIGTIAHQLKGSFATIGSKILAKTCSDIELNSKTDSMADLISKVTSIQKLLPQLENELRQFLFSIGYSDSTND